MRIESFKGVEAWRIDRAEKELVQEVAAVAELEDKECRRAEVAEFECERSLCVMWIDRCLA